MQNAAILKVSLETGEVEERTTYEFLEYLNKASIKVLKAFWSELSNNNVAWYMTYEYIFPVQLVSQIRTHIEDICRERGEEID